MITRERAREIATGLANDRYDVDGDVMELLDDFTIEKRYGWVFFYESRRRIENKGEGASLAGSSPILVEKADGRVRELGTARPVDQSLAEYERELRRLAERTRETRRSGSEVAVGVNTRPDPVRP